MIIRHIKGGQSKMYPRYNVGDKFVVKIGDILESSTEEDGVVYRIKGFNSLVFDEAGLEKLDKFKSYEDAIQEGRMFAQDVYNRLFDLNSAEFQDIFGKEGGSLKFILHKYTAEELDEKMKAYTPIYEVGDEIVQKESSDAETFRWLITFVSEDPECTIYYIMRKDGRSESVPAELMKVYRKTGRKFDSIDQFRS